MVAASTPVFVLILGLIVNRAAQRVEQAQWASRKLIEHRLDLFAKMAEPLNDLLCFFRLVGDFQKITPPYALVRKRELDKLFYTHQALMSEEFCVLYGNFMTACFLTYVGLGQDAQLRANINRQRAERGRNWDTEWDRYFVQQEGQITPLSALGNHYRALMSSFAEQIGVPPAGKRWAFRPRLKWRAKDRS